MSDVKKGGHGQGGRGGSVENRFPNVKAPAQRPADVKKGASNSSGAKGGK